MQRAIDGLWAENAQAWEFYSQLALPIVQLQQLGSWLVARRTAGWSIDTTLDFLRRLDLIRSILEPAAPHGTQDPT